MPNNKPGPRAHLKISKLVVKLNNCKLKGFPTEYNNCNLKVSKHLELRPRGGLMETVLSFKFNLNVEINI